MRTARAAVAAALLLGALGAGGQAGKAATSTGNEAEAQALLRRPALDAPRTVTVHPSTGTVKLDPTLDYVLRIPEGTVRSKGLTVVGGRRVVIEPGTLRYVPPAGSSPTWRVRGLYLKGQTELAWVAGLQIRGPLLEGIDLDQRSAKVSVVLRDIDLDPVTGSRTGHHADVLQTWAGPARLVVDGLRGTSNYQGFFLKPNQEFSGPKPRFFWFRDVQLDMTTGYYALWADGGSAYPVHVRSTSVKRNPTRPARDLWLWPKPSTGDATWRSVTAA